MSYHPSFIWVCLGENSYQNFLSIQRPFKWAFSLFMKTILCVIQTFLTTKNYNKNLSGWNLLPASINNNKSQYYDSVLQLRKKLLFLFLRKKPKLCVCSSRHFQRFLPITSLESAVLVRYSRL